MDHRTTHRSCDSIAQRDNTATQRSSYGSRHSSLDSVPTHWHNDVPSVARYGQPQQQQTSNGPSNGSSVSEQQCTSVEEELWGRFPSMFSRNRGALQTARSDSVIAMPSEMGRGCRVSTRFTPYSYQPRRGYGSSSRPAFRPRQEIPKLFVRNVFLVDANENKVPRGPFRHELYEKGCVVDFFEFCSSWTEERVVEELERAFENVLPAGIPSPR